MNSKKILISGGTGFVGQYLTRALLRDGYYVTSINRSTEKYSEKQAKNRSYVGWDEALAEVSCGQDVVINLAGESLFGQRWTREVKERIYNSRVESTRKLVDAMNRSEVKPGLFISASAVGIYGDRGEERSEERTCREVESG